MSLSIFNKPKRLFIWLVVLIVLSTCCVSFASYGSITGYPYSIDTTLVSNLPGYEYNPFDKEWTYSTKYTTAGTSDIVARVEFQVVGSDNYVTVPMIIIALVDAKPISSHKTIIADTIKILVNEKVYTFACKKAEDSADWAICEIGEIGKQMLQEIVFAKSIAYQISFAGQSTVIDIPNANVDYLQQKFWMATLDAIDYWDNFTPADLQNADIRAEASVK